MADQQILEQMDIPPRIHRIWFGGPIPETFQRWGEAWRDLHPGWRVKDWTSSEEIESLRLPGYLIRSRAKEIIPSDWKRFQADVLRLEVLYRYGGLYVDTDIEPHRSLGPLLAGRRCLVARSPNVDSHGYHAITNCVMAAVPGHPWIKALIEGLGEAIMKYQGKHLSRMIGPWHLDRTYADGDWPDVDVLNWPELKPWLTHYWNNGRRQFGRSLG